MNGWPRGGDEARVARTGGSGALGSRDWARTGRGASMLGSDVSEAKKCTWRRVRDQVLSFSQLTGPIREINLHSFVGSPSGRQQGKFQLHRYPLTSI